MDLLDCLIETAVKGAPEDRLDKVERIASSASWQDRAMTPTDFARFCNDILTAVDIDSIYPIGAW